MSLKINGVVIVDNSKNATLSALTSTNHIVTGGAPNTASTNSGALQVSGGAGISGGVFVGGVVTATNFYVGPWAVTTSTVGSTGYTGSASTATGYTGSTGFTGSAGPAGGYTGSIGYTGSTGAQGAVGYTGSSGSGGGTTLPTQTGNAGYYLTTNGTTLSWADVNPQIYSAILALGG